MITNIATALPTFFLLGNSFLCSSKNGLEYGGCQLNNYMVALPIASALQALFLVGKLEKAGYLGQPEVVHGMLSPSYSSMKLSNIFKTAVICGTFNAMLMAKCT